MKYLAPPFIQECLQLIMNNKIQSLFSFSSSYIKAVFFNAIFISTRYSSEEHHRFKKNKLFYDFTILILIITLRFLFSLIVGYYSYSNKNYYDQVCFHLFKNIIYSEFISFVFIKSKNEYFLWIL